MDLCQGIGEAGAVIEMDRTLFIKLNDRADGRRRLGSCTEPDSWHDSIADSNLPLICPHAQRAAFPHAVLLKQSFACKLRFMATIEPRSGNYVYLTQRQTTMRVHATSFELFSL